MDHRAVFKIPSTGFGLNLQYQSTLEHDAEGLPVCNLPRVLMTMIVQHGIMVTRNLMRKWFFSYTAHL